MAAPQNLSVLDELRFKTGLEISPRLSFRSELQRAIKKSYSSEGGTRDNPNHKQLGKNEIRRGGVLFHQFAASQSGSHPGSTGRREAEKDSGGSPRFRSDSSGHGKAGQRHSHRAAGVRHDDAYSRGWRLARSSIDPAGPAELADLENQDSLRYGYFRAARASGWALHGFDWCATDRSSRLDSANAIWREDCDAAAGDERSTDLIHRFGNAERSCRRINRNTVDASGHDPGYGPNGFGQEHDSLLFAEQIAPPFRQYRHGRRSRRICTPGNQPGACQYARQD